MKTQRSGKLAEDLALQYLLEQNLLLLERNYRCKLGEIDLVMQDDKSIGFVEVRYRAHVDFGGALESVDFRKQAKLVRAATRFLQEHGQLDTPARIDVFAMSALNLEPASVRWVKNAVES